MDLESYLSNDQLGECERIEKMLHFSMVTSIEKSARLPSERFAMALYITQSMHKKAADFVEEAFK